jgi:hypothetical protein
MAAAKWFPPIVYLVLSREWAVANGAARGDAVFVAGWVKRPFFVQIKTSIGDRLMAEGAAKMFGMPVGVQSGQVTAVNGLAAAFADMRVLHSQ